MQRACFRSQDALHSQHDEHPQRRHPVRQPTENLPHGPPTLLEDAEPVRKTVADPPGHAADNTQYKAVQDGKQEKKDRTRASAHKYRLCPGGLYPARHHFSVHTSSPRYTRSRRNRRTCISSINSRHTSKSFLGMPAYNNARFREAISVPASPPATPLAVR